MLSTGNMQIPYLEARLRPWVQIAAGMFPTEKARVRPADLGSEFSLHFPSPLSRVSAFLAAERQSEGAQGYLCKWWLPAWCVYYSEWPGMGRLGQESCRVAE